jgi:asparagine synthase (glutamine-hydrolysing)
MSVDRAGQTHVIVAPDVLSGQLWKRTTPSPGVSVSWRGHPQSDASTELAGLARRPEPNLLDEVGAKLDALRGHFAVVIETPDLVIAATDHSRSIPLYFAKGPQGWLLDDKPVRLRSRAGLGLKDVDPLAHLDIAMAGYTVGERTLYRGLEMLLPGELVLLARGNAPVRHRYYVYRPWEIIARDPGRFESDCKASLLDVFERMLASVKGRLLAVPISAGYDSRLIVSLAQHLGHRDIRCFTYGRPGNFEAETGRAICERLNVPWTFVPLSVTRMRDFFRSDLYRSYMDFAESCASTPFVQDVAAIATLLEQKTLPPDAVIVNGQSGDFITGNHIPQPLRSSAVALSAEDRKRRLLAAFAKKHFALWRFLRTPANLAQVEEHVWRAMGDAGGALGDPETDHGLYETAEFQDRQSKYVISGQRCYDMLGLDWRLPLWDASFMKFWQGVPLKEKAGQALYARTIAAANFGGVWQGMPVNRKTIRPLSIVPLRLIAKAATAPFGLDTWHEAERKYFQYWMELTCHTAAIPYRTWALDKRGARNTLSWLTEAYLARHGLPLDPSTGRDLQ